MKKFKQLFLTEEQKSTNIKVLLSTVEQYKIFTDELGEFLGEDLMTAPASTNVDINNCFSGGLLDHMIRVTKYATKLNEILPDSLKQSKESVVKVSFLSQIGKTKLFIPNNSKWHQDNLGKYYDYNDELTAMRIGERSAYYALNYGVHLTDAEYQAVIGYDVSDDDMMYKWYVEPLSDLLNSAIKFAIIEEKEKWKNFNKV